MLEAIATAVAILTGAFGLGVFLNRYTSQETQDAVWRNISNADRRRIASSAVNITTLSYEAIFSGRIGSWTFFRRSFAVYIVLFVLFLAFLGVAFPATFLRAISIYLVGDFKDITIVTALHLLGGVVFWLANCQTLYFLRLAQRDPRPTPLALIFYADFLLTASICVFGIGFLFWLHTLASLGSEAHDISVQVRIQNAQESLLADIARLRQHSPTGRATMMELYIQREMGQGNAATAVIARNLPSSQALARTRRDFELTTELYPQGGIPIRRLDDNAIQFIGPSGEVTGFFDVQYTLNSEWGRTFESDLTPAQICRQFLTAQPHSANRFTYVEHQSVVDNWDARSCQSGSPGTLRARVSLNRDNISKIKLLSLSFQIVFQDLVTGIVSGFQSYASVNPLYFLDPQKFDAIWLHEHMISETQSYGTDRLDRLYVDSFLAEEGTSLNILNGSIAGGTMISAVMATSFFTVILLVSSFVSIGLASIASLLTRLNSVFLIEKHPFVFVMIATGLLAVALRFALF